MQTSHVRTDRLQIRTNSYTKKTLERAAQYSHKTLSDFMISHSLPAAERLIEEQSCITLSKKDWNILMDALAHPPEMNDALKKAFKRHLS